MLSARERLMVALDVDTAGEAEILAAQLKEHVGVFKIGMQLYNSEGPEILRRFNRLGAKIFLDLKLHDIPNTVGKASAVLTGHGVFMFNVHAAGGFEMMKKAADLAREKAAALGIERPLLIAVTVLTSINQETLNAEVGIAGSVENQVVHWAELAQKAGLDGVVASPQEIKAIRQACGDDFLIVTPGVRPAWADVNDQKRIMTPGEAIGAGASYLVVGRPITGAGDPVEAAKKIVSEMEAGLSC